MGGRGGGGHQVALSVIKPRSQILSERMISLYHYCGIIKHAVHTLNLRIIIIIKHAERAEQVLEI